MSGVNRYLVLWVLVAACHLGRPPARISGVSIGSVRVAAVQPGLEDAIRDGLGQALSGQGLLARSGPPVTVEVLGATTRPVASDGGVQVHMARLEINVALGGPSPRSIVLADERSYGVGPGGTLDAAGARASIFRSLALTLTEQAVTWIVYGPAQESP